MRTCSHCGEGMPIRERVARAAPALLEAAKVALIQLDGLVDAHNVENARKVLRAAVARTEEGT